MATLPMKWRNATALSGKDDDPPVLLTVQELSLGSKQVNQAIYTMYT